MTPRVALGERRRHPAAPLATVRGPEPGWRRTPPRPHRLGAPAPLVAAVVLAACGGPAPCATNASCPEAEVCDLDAVCRPPPSSGAERFSRSAWLAPVDWAATGPAARADDAVALGGGTAAELFLAFGPLPPAADVRRALLVLHPHDDSARWAGAGELIVEGVEPFRGRLFPPRTSAAPRSMALARRPIAPGPARPIRLDLTAAVRRAGARLHLAVRLEGRATGTLVSPWHPDRRRRPRLELTLH